MLINKPKSLKKGNTIGFLAVSGFVEDKVKVNRAKKYFENLGYNIILSDNIYEENNQMSGSRESRVKAINDFFINPDIDAIFCVRGGFGTLKLIKHINYNIIAQNPKIFVGFSDITNLNAMFYKKSKMLSFYGPMPYVDFSSFISEFTKKNFFNMLNGQIKSISPTVYNVYGKCEESCVQGILWGGNLSSITSMVGLDFIPDEDFIFFIEDWHDPVYKIDRMLTQLLNVKKFKLGLKAIVVGEFLNCNDEQYFNNIFIDIKNELKIPVIGNYKITHNVEKLTIPYGILASLDLNCGEIVFLENIFSDIIF